MRQCLRHVDHRHSLPNDQMGLHPPRDRRTLACRRYHLAEWLRGWSLHTTGSRGHFDDDADRYGQRRPADHVRP